MRNAESEENGAGDGPESDEKPLLLPAAADSVDEEDDDETFESPGLNHLTDSQKQAEMEYQNMKLDLGYTGKTF